MNSIQIMTKMELETRKKELEEQFNKIRDDLASFIESTETVIKEKTNEMDSLSKEWNEINTEINKRDGKTRE